MVLGVLPLCQWLAQTLVCDLTRGQLYTGYEVTSGGWIVTYLLEVRHAEPTAAGYAAT